MTRFGWVVSRSRATNPWRLASLALTTTGVGAAVLITLAQHVVSLDGMTLDEGETAMYFEPMHHGGRVWQGPYEVQGRDRDGRLILTRDGRTIRADPDDVAPVNRW